MNPFEMVVLIVAITAAASIFRAKYGMRRGRGHQHGGTEMPLHDPDTARLREELKQLKDRVAVLERLATDGTTSLEREFEKLRERD